MKIGTITTVIIVVVFLAALGGYFFLKPGNTPAAYPTPASGGGQTVPIAKAYPNAPTGPTLTLGTSKGTVTVNNFYSLGSAAVGEDGVIIIKSTSGYQLTYDPSTSDFWISVAGNPFAAARAAAEADFPVVLGITNSDACKLNVSLGIPFTPGNPLSGKSLPLSFCAGSVQ